MIASLFATALFGTAAEEHTLAEFLLESTSGERVSLYAERPGRRLTALAFLEPGDLASQACTSALAACAAAYHEQGVLALAVSTAADRTAASDGSAQALRGANVPLLLDPDRVVAADAGVKQAGTVLLLDEQWRVIYRGAADDRFDGKALRPSANNDFLVNAIESALAGEPIDPDATAVGGPDLWVGAKPRAVTFHRDVAPLLDRHCVNCHRPDQPGPMTLITHDDAAAWAPMIAEVALSTRMPPWYADPRHGHWKNERRLTETEKQTLVRWAQSGAPTGSAAGAPARRVFADPEWQMGKPDFVVELPEAQPIPAEGVLQYRYVPLDPGFNEDFFVQAVEVRPSARAVTHHVIAYLLPPGVSPKDALRRPETILTLSALGGWAPGDSPTEYAPGSALLVKKGSTLLFELHYTPNGKPTSDRTRIGVRRARGEVTTLVDVDAAMNFGFRIPANRPDATFTAMQRITKPGLITNLMPHMHLRGKAMRFELEQHGERRTLLDVPHYYFNWQITYELTEPIAVAAGDVVHVTAVYDNSKDNPFNPNPNVAVGWGDQSFEEMLIGYFGWIDPPRSQE